MKRSLTFLLQLLRRVITNNKEYSLLYCEEPAPNLFARFLECLPEDLQAYYLHKGFELSKQSILFQRFMLEQAGIHKNTFIRAQLDAKEYQIWQERDLPRQMKKSA